MKKISLRLQNEIFEILQQEALKDQISVSDVIRQRILHYENDDLSVESKNFFASELQNQISEIHKTLSSLNKNEKQVDEIFKLVFEIKLLLREFLFERNGQILRKVDQILKQRLSKNEGRSGE